MEKHKKIWEMVKIIRGIGYCEGRLGNHKESEKNYKKALKLIKNINEPEKVIGKNYKNHIGDTYFYLSITYGKQGKWKQALKCLKKAKEYIKNYPKLEARIFQGEGKYLYYTKKYRQALIKFQKSADIYKTLNNEYKVLNLKEDIASCLHGEKKYIESLKILNEVISGYEKYNIFDPWIYFHKASSLESIGAKKDAEKEYYKSIEIIEKNRMELNSDLFRITYTGQNIRIYSRAILNLLDLKKIEEAYIILQKCKARTFTEMLFNKNFYFKKSPNLYKKLTSVRAEIEKVIHKSSGNIKTFKKLSDLQTEEYLILQEIQQEIWRGKKEKLLFSPWRTEKIQNSLKDEIVLDYLITYNSLVIFYITKKDFGFVKLNKSEDFYSELVNTTLQILSDSKNIGLDWFLSKISKYIIPETIKSKLKNHSNLIIIPFSILHNFPFSLLKIERTKYLCEYLSLTYLDNICLLNRPYVDLRDIFIVSNTTSDLPYSEKEAKKISSIFRNYKILTRNKAKKQKIIKYLKNYKNFHYAGHVISNIKGNFTGCLTLNDGILRNEEIMDLNLDLNLVFLNGCKSGEGKIIPGDEITSLSRAFHFAGAKNIITNLWVISDYLTHEMTFEFYKNLKKGMSSEVALQKTQKKAIKEKLSPFYWAPFKLNM